MVTVVVLREPNLVGSKFSSINPEFILVSSPVLQLKQCLIFSDINIKYNMYIISI